jgi:C4-type Zn-finger protein
MDNKKKFQRILEKSCPECEGFLSLVSRANVMEDGVEFSEQYIECDECGYSEKIKISHRKPDIYNLKWQ